MSLTTIFLIVMVTSIVLTIVCGIVAAIVADSNERMGIYVASIIAVAVFIMAAVVGLIGSIWSYNVNHRETVNRCVESGGFVYSVNETRYCLNEAPSVKWKM